MPVEIGAPAPSFTLRDQDKNEVSLESFRGKNTLVVFIPFPFTRICDGEICEIRDNVSRFDELDANVVIITAHALQTNKQWTVTEGLEFPVLSDFWPHGEVSRAYGAFNEALGVANRASYVLDAEGVVRSVIATDSLGTPREFDAYVEALAGLS